MTDPRPIVTGWKPWTEAAAHTPDQTRELTLAEAMTRIEALEREVARIRHLLEREHGQFW